MENAGVTEVASAFFVSSCRWLEIAGLLSTVECAMAASKRRSSATKFYEEPPVWPACTHSSLHDGDRDVVDPRRDTDSHVAETVTICAIANAT